MAWRNIWRNRRRTLITAASIFFAVFFALVMRSFQLGSYSHWINSMVENYTGHIQIHAKGFTAEPTIDNSFEYTAAVREILEADQNITAIVPRLEFGALASYKAQTKAAITIGIDPETEDSFSGVKEKLVKYRFTEKTFAALKTAGADSATMADVVKLADASFTHEDKMEFDIASIIGEEPTEKYFELIKENSVFENGFISKNDNGVLLGDRLSKFLNLNIGDTLVLTGVGYHGITAEGLFPVRGIVRIPAPELDKMLIYLTLPAAQELYSAPSGITSLVLKLDNHSDREVAKTIATLSDKIGSSYELKDWQELNELIVKQVEADNQGGIIMIGMLYVLIGFGVFGTVLMMTTERKREFGVMVAIGLQKTRLGLIVTLEMILIGFVGMVAGIAASLPLIWHFNINPTRLSGQMAAAIEAFGIEPVMPWAFEADIFMAQSLIVIMLVVIASAYPVYSITKLKVINALRA